MRIENVSMIDNMPTLPANIVNEIYLANKRQLELFLYRAEKELAFNWGGKVVTLLGTAFKQDTNDIRNSASIDIGYFLQAEGVKEIRIHDPAGLDYYKMLFPASEQFKYFDDSLESIKDSDVIIISTDWPQFRRLADKVLESRDRPLIMDGRRLWQYKYDEFKKAGFKVIAVGSQLIQ